MIAADRLSRRTGNAVPRRPATAADRAGKWPFSPGRAVSVPARAQVAWARVTAAMSRYKARDTGALAAVLSMAVVRWGTYADWSHIAAWLMRPPRFGRIATAVLRRLDRGGHLDEASSGIDSLVEELTERPPMLLWETLTGGDGRFRQQPAVPDGLHGPHGIRVVPQELRGRTRGLYRGRRGPRTTLTVRFRHAA